MVVVCFFSSLAPPLICLILPSSAWCGPSSIRSACLGPPPVLRLALHLLYLLAWLLLLFKPRPSFSRWQWSVHDRSSQLCACALCVCSTTCFLVCWGLCMTRGLSGQVFGFLCLIAPLSSVWFWRIDLWLLSLIVPSGVGVLVAVVWFWVAQPSRSAFNFLCRVPSPSPLWARAITITFEL